MDPLFKKCFLFVTFIGIPVFIGPMTIILLMLTGTALINLTSGNLFMQFMAIAGVIATILIPDMFFTYLLYWSIRVLQKAFTEDQKPFVEKYDEYKNSRDDRVALTNQHTDPDVIEGS